MTATDPKRPQTPPSQPDPAVLSRRQFMNRLTLGLSGLTGAIMGLPVVGFLLAPLLHRTPEQWQAVGKLADFQVGQTVEVTFADPSPLPWAGIVAKTAAWLRRDNEQQFTAFAVNCTHLGCPVRWLQDANLFMCPCHGGVFYGDGRPAAGPPPNPLPQYQVRVNNGQVEILTRPTPIAVKS